jgi:hypothetical protein
VPFFPPLSWAPLHCTSYVLAFSLFFWVDNCKKKLQEWVFEFKLRECELSGKSDDFQWTYLIEHVRWVDKSYCTLAMGTAER